MKDKRPLTLTLTAGLLVLAALLAFASPFLPGGPRGGFAGQPPLGTLMPGGQMSQAQAPQVQPPNTSGQPPAFGASGGPGDQLEMPGGSSTFMNLQLPVRIAASVAGGLAALLAALGLWRQKKWGMVIALLVAVGSLLAAALTFLTALLGRLPWLVMVTSSTWQAVAGVVIAIGVAVLVLLPRSQMGYMTAPRERQVM